MPSDLICAECGAYLGETPGSKVSHGLCQECFREQLRGMGMPEPQIEAEISRLLGPPKTRRTELRGAAADPRIRAIRKDPKIGRDSGSATDENMTDEDLLEELNEQGITSPKRAVEHLRRIDRIWEDQRGRGTGLYEGL